VHCANRRVLVAAGRRSNTGCLNLAAAGLAPGDRGDLEVDGHYRTAVQHIYAAGDVIGFPGLASTGMQQARRAMTVAFGGADDLRARGILPSGVYTIPEVAMVGDTEQAVQAAGVNGWRQLISDLIRGRRAPFCQVAERFPFVTPLTT